MTVTKADRATTRCIECGQDDDHPKVHFGVDTYHNDCLPPAVRSQVVQGDSSGRALKIIQAAEKGTRGEKLLAHIEKLSEED